jgi:hypothetical protein
MRQAGSIVKKRRRYYIIYRTATGKQKWEGGFETKAQARNCLTEILGQIQTGGFFEPSEMTFEIFADQWLKNRISIGGATWEGYDSYLRAHIKPELGRMKLKDIRHSHIQALITRLATQEHRKGRPLSANVAFYFHRNQFPVLQWKPQGAEGNEGEYVIRAPGQECVFVEVKAPVWEGELSPMERDAGRIKLGKHINGEARAIAPWERIQFEVDKAYKKFLPTTKNLLVIADDLVVSLAHGTDMQARLALYSEHTQGRFADSR